MSGGFNVFDVRDRLISDFSNYIRGFISIRDQRIRNTVELEFEKGLLWPDPLIQLNPSSNEVAMLLTLLTKAYFMPSAQGCSDGKKPRKIRAHLSDCTSIRSMPSRRLLQEATTFSLREQDPGRAWPT